MRKRLVPVLCFLVMAFAADAATRRGASEPKSGGSTRTIVGGLDTVPGLLVKNDTL